MNDIQQAEIAEFDLTAAIARIEESRASHQAWDDHLAACEHCAEHGPPPFIQTREEHQQIVREYDGVLAILRGVVLPPGQSCACGTDATSLTPGEVVVHRPDACTIETAKTEPEETS